MLCAWQRLGAWAAAGQAAALTTLSARRRAQARERDNPHLAGHVTDEVAAALVLTGRAAQQLVDDAAGLARLPPSIGLWRPGSLTGGGRKCSPPNSLPLPITARSRSRTGWCPRPEP